MFHFILVLFLGNFAFAAKVESSLVSSDTLNVTSAQAQTEYEPDTFSFGSTIVSTFSVEHFSHSGAAAIGWASSKDGGHTWANGLLPGVSKYFGNGIYDGAGDSVVTYDARDKVWLISEIGIYEKPFQGAPVTGAAVLVNRSEDGVIWDSPVTAKLVGNDGFYDKDWIVCDNHLNSPFYGNCYLQWDVPFSAMQLYMSTSSDGGRTWDEPVTTPKKAGGLGGQPLVQNDGKLVIPYVFGGSLNSIISSDGGKSFSEPAEITKFTAHPVTNGLVLQALPSAEISGDGTIYMVWSDCRFSQNCVANNLVLSKSSDGVNWTAPKSIPTGTGDFFLPGLAVDNGTLGVKTHLQLSYYYYPAADCKAEECKLMIGSIYSEDGGEHWTNPVEVAGPMDWKALVTTRAGKSVGDYINTSFINGVGVSVLGTTTAKLGLSMFAYSVDFGN